jgi:hypothetical protein
MPQPKHPKHEPEHERERRPDHDRRRKRDEEDGGDDAVRHAAILARRWLGSPPPTTERYARALQQWHALPGAVFWPATDVTIDAAAARSAGKEGKS